MSRRTLVAASIATLALFGAANAQDGERRRDGPATGQQQPTPPQQSRGTGEQAPAARGDDGKAEGPARAAERKDDAPRAKGAPKKESAKGATPRRNADADRNNSDNKANAKRTPDRTTPRVKAAEPKSEPRVDRKEAEDRKGGAKNDVTKGKSVTAPVDKRAPDGKAANDGKAATNGNTAATAGPRPQLTETQRTTIRDTLVRERPRRVTNVNITIRIGNRVPRGIRLSPLPVVLVSSYPFYRDYRYVYVQDSICIVDPNSYEIVEVIDTRGADVRSASLTLTSDQQRFIYGAVIDRAPRVTLNLRLGIGAEVPRTVAVQRFPERVITRVPRLANYRFVVDQDQVVILNPSSYEVAMVIAR